MIIRSIRRLVQVRQRRRSPDRHRHPMFLRRIERLAGGVSRVACSDAGRPPRRRWYPAVAARVCVCASWPNAKPLVDGVRCSKWNSGPSSVANGERRSTGRNEDRSQRLSRGFEDWMFTLTTRIDGGLCATFLTSGSCIHRIFVDRCRLSCGLVAPLTAASPRRRPAGTGRSGARSGDGRHRLRRRHADTDMWGVTTAGSLYMVSSAAGSTAHPGRSRQEGTRWKSGTVPQR